MAKPRKFLKKILQMLNKRPMTSGYLCRITKKHRKIIRQNLKIAEKEGLVYQDGLRNYHLAPRGKFAINYIERTKDLTRWQIESQEIDPIGLISNRPKAICTLVTENAEKIKELDNRTASKRFNVELPGNETLIRSALARVVDSILQTIGKDMQLFTVRDGQLAENSSFNFLDQFPGYDFARRYEKLAKTDFKLLIEFNGKEWVNTQIFDDLEKQIDDRRKSLSGYYYEKILSHDRRRRINEAIQHLIQVPEDYLKFSHLFRNEEDIRKYLYKQFSFYGEKSDDLQEIVNKGYECGLFQTEKKVLYSLKVNSEKYQFFMNLIKCGDRSP
jgi:regulatory ArsR family protein